MPCFRRAFRSSRFTDFLHSLCGGLFNALEELLNLREQAHIAHLQVIVFRKIHDEIPSHYIEVLHGRINNHAAYVVERSRFAPRRVVQVACASNGIWAETTHHAG